jgi:hypothetical protein
VSAGNLDTPRNRGAADTALANARPVSPPASYLKRPQVTKGPCSWLGPRSSGSLTSATLRGPAAIRHPWRGAALAASMPLGPLHATCVRPAPKSRFVASELTRMKIKIKSHSVLGRYAIPVGDAGGHDGSDSGLSVADEPPDLPQSSDRGPGCQSSSVSHRVRCTAGNLDTPRNRGAADTALANARPVSPPASYLIGPQVTKGPGSRLGPRSSGSLTSATLRGPAAIHAARPTPRHLRSACTQVAICVVWDIAHLEARSKANAALGFHPNPVGDAGGHDGSEAVRHLADEPSDPPLRCCRTAPAAHTRFRVQLEIWIRHVIAARLIGLWLTPDLFRLRRVT